MERKPLSEPKTRFIVVRIPSRLADDLERRADTEGRSRSEVVREALAAHVRPAAPELSTLREEEKARAMMEGRQPEKVERDRGFLGMGMQ